MTESPLPLYEGMRKPRGAYRGKRLFDIVLIFPALPIWAVAMIVVGLSVLARIGRPVFFVQERAGVDGVSFNLLKFRSMSDTRDEHGQLLPDDQRLGKFGNLLRSTSLDELPQVINVLRGEMSLVGPRPLPPKYISRYSARQALRLKLLPGITGYDQVNGRNSGTWSEKFERDAYYLEHCSFWLDVRILLSTVRVVLLRKDISQSGTSTRGEFLGE